MSKARELAELGAVYDSGSLSNRNLVYNGSFEVAQRGETFSVTAAYTDYTLDRWRFYNTNGGAHTATKSTTVPNNSFKNSFKLDCTTADTSLAAGDYNIFAQLFEGQDLIRAGYGTSSAKKLTLSFWVRSNKTGTYYAELQLNSGGQASVPYTINAADTWEHKTCTFNGKTDSAPAYDNSVEMYLYFWLSAGSGFTSGTNSSGAWGTTTSNRVPGQVNFADSTSNEWYITGIQLEVGDAATPYEYRSFGDELARCQRYYYSLTDGQTAYVTQGYQYTNSGSWSMQTPMPVTMRSAPSLTGNWTTTGYFLVYSNNLGQNTTNLSMNGSNTRCSTIASPSTDAGDGGIAGGLYAASGLSQLAFNAEL